MPGKRKRRQQRADWHRELTGDALTVQREAAFAAIRALYRESLPLWRVCPRGICRRHKHCAGDADCLRRGWPLLPIPVQEAAAAQVRVGGPRRLPPASRLELHLRRYPPSNFVR
jgi:hypothetical protein